MVISYYPGSGGYRLNNKLLGEEFITPNKIYDFQNISAAQFKYLYNNSKFEDDCKKTILTHCMDIVLIKNIFPNRKVIQIIGDYKKSLLRQWVLMTREFKKEFFENELDNAFMFIRWHDHYYKEYPQQGLADVIVDIDNSTDDFAIIMQNELKLEDQIFEWAWSIYKQYGNNASTITLYKEYINGKK